MPRALGPAVLWRGLPTWGLQLSVLLSSRLLCPVNCGPVGLQGPQHLGASLYPGGSEWVAGGLHWGFCRDPPDTGGRWLCL